jgi:hypothetical protein
MHEAIDAKKGLTISAEVWGWLKDHRSELETLAIGAALGFGLGKLQALTAAAKPIIRELSVSAAADTGTVALAKTENVAAIAADKYEWSKTTAEGWNASPVSPYATERFEWSKTTAKGWNASLVGPSAAERFEWCKETSAGWNQSHFAGAANLNEYK